MVTLEKILQNYFHCKKPFPNKENTKEKLQMTVSGYKAYERLCSLVEDLGSLGVLSRPDRALEELNRILHE